MAAEAVEVRGAVRSFGETRAVDGVDLAVREGEIFGLIGHNGAGKTTLFKMMLGLLPMEAGEVRIAGRPVRGEAFREVRRRIGYLPENVALYGNLTGLETLRFFARLKGVDGAACGPMLERTGLAAAAGRRVRGYSKGMRQRLGIAQALLGEPRLLFLDEPTNGLDPKGIRELYAIVAEARARGTTVILTSHILAEIQQRVDRLALMRNGRIRALGTVAELREGLRLPLEIEVLAGAGRAAALRQALAAQGFEVAREAGGALVVRCDRSGKLEALRVIPALEGVRDVRLLEPSLEEVFMGYAGDGP